MTDLETVKSMLSKAKVSFEQKEDKSTGNIHIEVSDHSGPLEVGYFGFVSVLYFDKQGAFLDIGAWE